MKNNVIDNDGARLVDLLLGFSTERSRSAQHSLHTHGRRRRPANRIKGTERAGHPVGRKVLKVMFWEVPPADWLIL